MSVNLYNATTDTLKNVAGDIVNPKSVNEMIAPIEDGTASKAYAVGEQFIMNDLLCEATQAIAQGDTMVIGTNCEESEQLSKQVKDIKDSLPVAVQTLIHPSGLISQIDNVNVSIRTYGRVVLLYINFTTKNSDVSRGTGLFSLINQVSLPIDHIPIRMIRNNDWSPVDCYLNAYSGEVIPLQNIAPDTYKGVATYVI